MSSTISIYISDHFSNISRVIFVLKNDEFTEGITMGIQWRLAK